MQDLTPRSFYSGGAAARDGGGRKAGGHRLWWHEWVARLCAAGISYADVMAMPWTLARDFLESAARIERERLLYAAIAARAAQADEKGWQKWVDGLSR